MGEGSQNSTKLSYRQLNQQGLNSLKDGSFEKAKLLLSKSLEISPNQPEIIAKRIECLIQLGHLSEAENDLRAQLHQTPQDETLLNYLGHILMVKQKAEEAAKVFLKATRQDNCKPLSLYNLATAELELQNWDAAKEALEKVLAIEPQYVDAIHGMGLVHLGKQQSAEAKAYLTLATKLNPQNSATWYDLGNVNMDLELWNEAKKAFQFSLKQNPQYLNAAINLSQVLIHLESFGEAKALITNLLKISPNEWRSWFNLGQLFYRTGNFSSAIECFEKALGFELNNWEIYNALGITWHEISNFRVAEKMLLKAIEINPQAADAHWNYALTSLSLGNFAEGWKTYEWRWKRKSFPTKSPKTVCKTWEGEEGTLCLHTEQGYGDNIQFFRFIQDAKELCQGKIVLYAEKALCKLFNTSKEVEVRAKEVNWENELSKFNYHLPLMSLPKILKKPPSDYGKVTPYIYTRQSSGRNWEDHFKKIDSQKVKVGLAWQGNQNNKPGLKRSVPEKIFLEWLDSLPDSFALFSLQPEDTSQSKHTLSGRKIFTFQQKPQDFAETAAFIKQMDLVISVDTAVAHLAGAMGLKLYLLLYATPDWRWINGNRADLWYPETNIFRQNDNGDWLPPLSDLGKTIHSEYS